MAMMEEAVAAGLTSQAVCATMGVSERRFRRWRARARQGDLTRHPKPASVQPANALTPQEAGAIQEAVACAEWADLSCRELSIKLMEQEGLYVSHVAIWEHEKRLGIAGHRGKRRLMGRHRGAAPDTSFVTGPNQLWSWDFTKLPTGVPHQFWYLCAVLDRYSRKVVGWAVSAHADSALAQTTWDLALLAEGRSGQAMPFSLSDRGPQMRSRTTREFFHDLGVAQLFARPRTPNDNAHTESLFATVKTAPAYPAVCPTLEAARAYFQQFFAWYNGEHLHTRIGMVTPNQKHSGEWQRILADREVIKTKTFAMRREYHRRIREANKHVEAVIS
jgi:transposase InsO family protein